MLSYKLYKISKVILSKSLDEIKKYIDSLSFIKYGVCIEGKIICGDKLTSKIFLKHYKNLKPKELIKQKCGVCWDTSHMIYLELIQKGYECKEIYLETNCPPDMPTHSFVCIKIGHKWHIAEYSWYNYRGLSKPFNSLQEIYKYYSKLMIEQTNRDNKTVEKDYEVIFFDISGDKHPGYGLSAAEYMKIAEKKENKVFLHIQS